MSIKTELHLIVPGLCGPLANTDLLKNNPAFNGWLKRLSQAKHSSSPASLYDVITSIFHLTINDDFPSAALTLLANNRYDENKHFMFADPVHLQADINQAILTSAEDLNIDDQESVQLLQTLNNHFQQDALDFFALENNQWMVSTDFSIDMKTTALVDAVARNIHFILPEGKSSTRWRQWLTEAQMLLHSHQVNSHREDAGQATINSLWFHGCGGLPGIDKSPCNKNKISSVCSNYLVLKGVADLVGCDYFALPNTVSDYTEHLLEQHASNQGDNTINVLHLSSLEHWVNYTDVSLWLENLIVLLGQWLYPLFTMANKNNIQIILYPCTDKKYYFSKYDFLKIWQQVKLEQHIRCY